MVKKLFGLLLCGILVFGLIGCEINKGEKKQVKGQEQVNQLVEKLGDTKKIILAVDDEDGEIYSFDIYHHYAEIKTMTNGNTIKEILDILSTVELQDEMDADYKGKLLQFYGSNDKIIAEYEGHALVTEKQKLPIYIKSNNGDPLFKYFNE